MPTPATHKLQALKQHTSATGLLTRCIEAGFIKGSVSGQQATEIKESLAYLIGHCEALQTTVNKLQAELATAQQSKLFN